MSGALHSEILKLLLQVAFADNEIEEGEVQHILKYAEDNDVGELEIEILKGFLNGEGALPPPNFGLLREHKEVVIQEARSLIRADKSVCENEQEVFQEIEELLGV